MVCKDACVQQGHAPDDHSRRYIRTCAILAGRVRAEMRERTGFIRVFELYSRMAMLHENTLRANDGAASSTPRRSIEIVIPAAKDRFSLSSIGWS